MNSIFFKQRNKLIILSIIMLTMLVTFATADPSLSVTFNDSVTPTSTFNSTSLPVKLTTTSSLDTYSLVNLDTTLKGWFRLEDDLTDDSGFNNHLSLADGEVTYVAGKFGKALSFNGSNDYLVGANPFIDFDGSFTVSLWIKASTDGTQEGILCKEMFFCLVKNNSKVQYLSMRSDWNFRWANAEALDDTWHMITVTYDGSTEEFYLDGVSIFTNNTTVDTPTSSAAPLYLGSITGIGRAEEFFEGLLDDILIVKRALSVNEIKALYNSQVTEYEETFTVSTDVSHTIKGYAVDSDGDMQYTSERTLTYSTASVPTVTVSSASSVEKRTAVLNASVTDDGGASTTDRGFYYGESTAYGSIASTTASGGVGSFSESITGLSCNTTYHFMAFAINSEGMATSSDTTFKTDGCGGRPLSSTITSSPVTGVTASSTESSTSTSGNTSTGSDDSGLGVDSSQGGNNNGEEQVDEPKTQRFVFKNNLQLRTENADVLELQRFLNSNGFIVSEIGAGSPGNETTYFGTMTYRALQRFQASVGIPSTGFFGPITRAYVNGI